MDFTRDTVYIANILKCRPDTPGQTMGNRKPAPEEMQTCLPYLLAQLDIIEPKVIVALGATAVEGLLGKTGGITKLRGHWQQFRGVPVMPTYHRRICCGTRRSVRSARSGRTCFRCSKNWAGPSAKNSGIIS